jgi:putative alpha-1,2-mannosidase
MIIVLCPNTTPLPSSYVQIRPLCLPEEIIRGGVLELNMASEPNDWGKVERPPSMAIGAR